MASAADVESRAELEHLQTATERHSAECHALIVGDQVAYALKQL
jgi:hypothetical protein